MLSRTKCLLVSSPACCCRFSCSFGLFLWAALLASSPTSQWWSYSFYPATRVWKILDDPPPWTVTSPVVDITFSKLPSSTMKYTIYERCAITIVHHYHLVVCSSFWTQGGHLGWWKWLSLSLPSSLLVFSDKADRFLVWVVCSNATKIMEHKVLARATTFTI